LDEDHEEGEDLGVSLEGSIGDFGLLSHVQILQTVIKGFTLYLYYEEIG
jgi:hypothetical protein